MFFKDVVSDEDTKISLFFGGFHISNYHFDALFKVFWKESVIGYWVHYLGLLVLLLKNLHVLKYNFVLQVYYLYCKSVLQYRYLVLIYGSTSTLSTKCT